VPPTTNTSPVFTTQAETESWLAKPEPCAVALSRHFDDVVGFNLIGFKFNDNKFTLDRAILEGVDYSKLKAAQADIAQMISSLQDNWLQAATKGMPHPVNRPAVTIASVIDQNRVQRESLLQVLTELNGKLEEAKKTAPGKSLWQMILGGKDVSGPNEARQAAVPRTKSHHDMLTALAPDALGRSPKGGGSGPALS
jgi:hypothetical protein